MKNVVTFLTAVAACWILNVTCLCFWWELLYHENLSSRAQKKVLTALSFPYLPSQPGIIVPASHLTLSVPAHPSLQSAPYCPPFWTPPISLPFLLTSFLLPAPLCHSLYVQGAVPAWDRGQAPLQKELRDSHHERRESCQSGLHIAPRRGASSSRGGVASSRPMRRGLWIIYHLNNMHHYILTSDGVAATARSVCCVT